MLTPCQALTRGFAGITSFNSPKEPVGWALVWCSFDRWFNWGSERWGFMPKLTQLISGRVGTKTQASFVPPKSKLLDAGLCGPLMHTQVQSWEPQSRSRWPWRNLAFLSSSHTLSPGKYMLDLVSIQNCHLSDSLFPLLKCIPRQLTATRIERMQRKHDLQNQKWCFNVAVFFL